MNSYKKKRIKGTRIKWKNQIDRLQIAIWLQQLFTQVRQSIKARCDRTYISYEAIVVKLICYTLAAGLHQVTWLEMDVILRVTDGEIFIFSMQFCSSSADYL